MCMLGGFVREGLTVWLFIDLQWKKNLKAPTTDREFFKNVNPEGPTIQVNVFSVLLMVVNPCLASYRPQTLFLYRHLGPRQD